MIFDQQFKLNWQEIYWDFYEGTSHLLQIVFL